MTVACRQCDEQIVDNALFCGHCGATQHPELFRPTAVAARDPEPVADPWFLHALRFIGVAVLLSLAWLTFILGLLWRMRMLNVTGYRRADVLWIWVPGIGWVLGARTLWRYTAREAYWQPRDDRPSHVLEGPNRPLAIGAGWLAVPVIAAGAAVAWVDDDGRCVVEEVRERMDAAGEFSFGDLGDAIDGALERCDIDVDFDGDPEPAPTPEPTVNP